MGSLISFMYPDEMEPATYGTKSNGFRISRAEVQRKLVYAMRLSFRLLIVVAMGFCVFMVSMVAHTPRSKPWFQCLSRISPDAELVNHTGRMAELHGAWCSTQDTPYAQACVCCVLGQDDCWRSAEITRNSSSTAVIRDKPDQVVLERRIPTKIRFCYKRIGESECITEEGWKVGYVLRAIELLNGWKPAGDRDEM